MKKVKLYITYKDWLIFNRGKIEPMIGDKIVRFYEDNIEHQTIDDYDIKFIRENGIDDFVIIPFVEIVVDPYNSLYEYFIKKSNEKQ